MWTIIYTFTDTLQPIHIEYLQKYNPEAQIILANITNNNYPHEVAWQISDLFIRNWLKENLDKIKYTNIAIIEWDVLVNTKLPDLNLNKDIYVGGIAKYPEDKNWYWFKDISKLPEYLLPYKIGCCPTGFILCGINAIESWLDPQFNEIYKKHIISELRLFSIFNYLGFNIIKYPSNTILHKENKFDLNKVGIFHPVKQKYISS